LRVRLSLACLALAFGLASSQTSSAVPDAPTADPECEARIIAGLERARFAIAEARWDAADEVIAALERDQACAANPRRLLVKLGGLRRDAFQPREAKRLYEAALSVDGSAMLAKLAQGEIRWLTGEGWGSDLSLATRITNFVCWNWLSIDMFSMHGILIHVWVRAVCRRAWLAGTLLLLATLLVLFDRSRNPDATRPAIKLLARAMGPLWLFWALFFVLPIVVAATMYAARVPLPDNSIVITELLPYGTFAIGCLWFNRRAAVSALRPRRLVVVLQACGIALSAVVFGLAMNRPGTWMGTQWTPWKDPVNPLVPAALFVLNLPLAAFVEEFVYRDRLWAELRPKLGPLVAALLSSCVFALVHDRGWAGTVALLALSEMLRLAYERLGGLIGSGTVHWLTNLVLVCVQVACGGGAAVLD